MGELEHLIAEMNTNLELIEMEPEEISFQDELAKITSSINKKMRDLEIRSFLNGKYDSHDCYLSLSSGAGGVDAMDWTEILFHIVYGLFPKKEFQIYRFVDLVWF